MHLLRQRWKKPLGRPT